MASENWQENTENTINILTSTSANLAKDLYFFNILQKTLRKHELKVINEIKEIQNEVSFQIASNFNMSIKALNHYSDLVNKYEKVGQNVINSYTTLENTLSQGKNQISDIFQQIIGKLDFIANLQQWLISQFFDFQAFIFYLSFGILVFISTSFERTLSSRFPLLLLTACNYFIEALLLRCLNSENSIIKIALCQTYCSPGKVQEIIGIERGLFLLICAASFLYMIFSYKNYQQVNNQILVELKNKFRYIERTPYWVKKYFSHFTKIHEETIKEENSDCT